MAEAGRSAATSSDASEPAVLAAGADQRNEADGGGTELQEPLQLRIHAYLLSLMGVIRKAIRARYGIQICLKILFGMLNS
jgi:hypothetical protein